MTSAFVNIRSQQSRDDAAVEALLASAAEEQKNYRGQFTDVLHGDNTFVAEVGDSVVGMLQYMQAPNGTALITCVHVHPKAREVGIADALILHVLQHLLSQKVTWVSAHAQPGDRALKNLFERHGLVAQSILVGKSLSDPSTAERASQ